MAAKAISQLALREVKLGQVPKWLASCSFTPGAFVGAVNRARCRYAAKYINVVRNNFTPYGHLIAVSVTILYCWRYQNEVHHRNKKYHW